MIREIHNKWFHGTEDFAQFFGGSCPTSDCLSKQKFREYIFRTRGWANHHEREHENFEFPCYKCDAVGYLDCTCGSMSCFHADRVCYICNGTCEVGSDDFEAKYNEWALGCLRTTQEYEDMIKAEYAAIA